MAPSAPLLLAAALALAAPGGETVPRGRHERLAVDSWSLRGRHDVEVWIAPGAGAAEGPRSPVLYIVDDVGGRALEDAAVTLDRLVADGRLSPLLLVRVAPLEPGERPLPAGAFERFVVTELVPLVDSRYRTRREPDGRGLWDVPGGARRSLDLAARHPRAFGRCAGSPAPAGGAGAATLVAALECLAGDDRVSLDVKDADLGEVVRGLVEGRGVSLLTPADLGGTVTATVTDVPWEQVLDLVLAGNGYAFVREGKVIRVLRREDLLKELASPVPR